MPLDHDIATACLYLRQEKTIGSIVAKECRAK